MTVTNNEPEVEGQDIIVRDEIGPLTFRGQTLVDNSWSYEVAEERGHTHWTDITLYRVRQEGTPFKYVVQVVGRSVIYHSPDGPCGRGMNVHVGLLRRDEARYQAMVACRACNPTELDELDDSDLVSAEVDIPSLYKCVDAAAVVKVMQNRGVRNNPSGPNVRLLQNACLVDPEIAEAMSRVRRL